MLRLFDFFLLSCRLEITASFIAQRWWGGGGEGGRGIFRNLPLATALWRDEVSNMMMSYITYACSVRDDIIFFIYAWMRRFFFFENGNTKSVIPVIENIPGYVWTCLSVDTCKHIPDYTDLGKTEEIVESLQSNSRSC